MKIALMGPELLDALSVANKITIEEEKTIIECGCKEDAETAKDAIIKYFGNKTEAHEYYRFQIQGGSLQLTKGTMYE